ncbi:hypothetical protein E2C01_051098 [Portunus trituberculatus]|uniref:Uncharacterized protein n=1 Tax=Portunus trituberculatus TaxID=210409 RepID=A0A5B7GKW1_PORTR|nr:hypothetical protein [Portunus trituberculatus]
MTTSAPLRLTFYIQRFPPQVRLCRGDWRLSLGGGWGVYRRPMASTPHKGGVRAGPGWGQTSNHRKPNAGQSQSH